MLIYKVYGVYKSTNSKQRGEQRTYIMKQMKMKKIAWRKYIGNRNWKNQEQHKQERNPVKVMIIEAKNKEL